MQIDDGCMSTGDKFRNYAKPAFQRGPYWYAEHMLRVIAFGFKFPDYPYPSAAAAIFHSRTRTLSARPRRFRE